MARREIPNVLKFLPAISRSNPIRRGQKGIILDTNLLLVYLVGNWDLGKVGSAARTDDYTADDYYTLCNLIEQFGKLVVTPHILTEVCDLAEKDNLSYNGVLFEHLMELCCDLRERRQESVRVMKAHDRVPYRVVGLADAALVEASVKGYFVVTNDRKCSQCIEACNGNGIFYGDLVHAQEDPLFD